MLVDVGLSSIQQPGLLRVSSIVKDQILVVTCVKLSPHPSALYLNYSLSVFALVRVWFILPISILY